MRIRGVTPREGQRVLEDEGVRIVNGALFAPDGWLIEFIDGGHLSLADPAGNRRGTLWSHAHLTLKRDQYVLEVHPRFEVTVRSVQTETAVVGGASLVETNTYVGVVDNATGRTVFTVDGPCAAAAAREFLAANYPSHQDLEAYWPRS